MKTAAPIDAQNSGFWKHIQLEGELSAPQARALLKLQLSQRDQQRMRELSAKARAGTLTADEEVEIEDYERFGCLLDVLHSKARVALRPKRKTAS